MLCWAGASFGSGAVGDVGDAVGEVGVVGGVWVGASERFGGLACGGEAGEGPEADEIFAVLGERPAARHARSPRTSSCTPPRDLTRTWPRPQRTRTPCRYPTAPAPPAPTQYPPPPVKPSPLDAAPTPHQRPTPSKPTSNKEQPQRGLLGVRTSRRAGTSSVSTREGPPRSRDTTMSLFTVPRPTSARRPMHGRTARISITVSSPRCSRTIRRMSVGTFDSSHQRGRVQCDSSAEPCGQNGSKCSCSKRHRVGMAER